MRRPQFGVCPAPWGGGLGPRGRLGGVPSTPCRQLWGLVAVVGGSGGGLVSLAFKKGADLLLTGDVSYHHALEAETLGMALIDGGHFHTEKIPFRIFAQHLNEAVAARGWAVTIAVDEDEKDPMGDG